jgi:hypothetical protein
MISYLYLEVGDGTADVQARELPVAHLVYRHLGHAEAAGHLLALPERLLGLDANRDGRLLSGPLGV